MPPLDREPGPQTGSPYRIRAGVCGSPLQLACPKVSLEVPHRGQREIGTGGGAAFYRPHQMKPLPQLRIPKLEMEAPSGRSRVATMSCPVIDQ
jgi:hypothetical protein